MYKLKYPISIEREYHAQLRKMVKALQTTTETRYDADDDESDSEKAVALLLLMYNSSNATENAISQVSNMAGMMKSYTGEQLQELMEDRFGDDLTWPMKVRIFDADPKLKRLLQEWTSENIKLIKSIPTQYFDRLQGIISDGVINGATKEEAAININKLYKSTQARAELISTDQIGKLNGQLMKYRQQDLGLKYYKWNTVKDSRVRKSHAEREGKLFAWEVKDAGKVIQGQYVRRTPQDGSPGIPIRCRCLAQPVITKEMTENV